MTVINSFAIILLSAIIHASFQLSLSVLTLLSSHSLGSRKTHSRLLKLTSNFIIGVISMTFLLIASTSFIANSLFNSAVPQFVWSVVCGLVFGVAVSVWLFYYKKQKGTTLWVPRTFANYLTNRTKTTKSSAEAFILGLSSVASELLFIIAPILLSALAITQLPYWLQIIGIIAYTIVSTLSVIIVWALVGSGHSLASIQRWRENNKYFLQFSSGASLMILGLFVYSYYVLGITIGLK